MKSDNKDKRDDELGILSLSYKDLNSVDLSKYLHSYPVTYIDLAGNKLGTLDLDPLRDSKSLRSLSLSGNMLSEIDLQPLASCSNLEYINLSANRLASIDLYDLGKYTSISRILLDDNMLQSINLESVKSWANIQQISLSGNSLESIDIPPLGDSNPIQYVDFSGNKLEQADLSGLRNCGSLSTLYLQKNELREIDLYPLSTTPNLQVLGIGNNPLCNLDLAPLGNCPDLKAVWLNDLQTNAINLHPLAECKHLHCLWLNGNRLKDIDLQPLNANDEIRYINLSQNRFGFLNTTEFLQKGISKEVVVDPGVQVSIGPNSYTVPDTGERIRVLQGIILSPTSIDTSGIFHSRYVPEKERMRFREFFDSCFRIDTSKAKKLLARVKKANTNDEKKNSLEKLAEYLFGCVDGFEIRPSTRTSTGEIDRIVRNNRSDHPLFNWIGMDFPIEAKNWSSVVGSEPTEYFSSKPRRARCNLGVLITTTGISGNEYRDAMKLVNDIYLMDSLVVAVFDIDDLTEISEGANLLEMLRSKIERVRYG